MEENIRRSNVLWNIKKQETINIKTVKPVGLRREEMKVGIITFHFVNNFGGALQTYALQQAIKNNLGTECEIIDYRNWFIRFTDTVRLFPITTSFYEMLSGLKTIKNRLGRVGKFHIFIESNCVLSRKYVSKNSLIKNPPKYDKYICGSDQIWNPTITLGVNANYYLGFVHDSDKKVAYAPSFGTDTIKEKYQKTVSNYISSFKYLSVRETAGQKIIKELTGRNVPQLINPTFLLSKENWESVEVKPHFRGKYILLYIMQRDDSVYEYARKVKERLGLPIIEISRYGYNPGFIDKTYINLGPAEFLGLFHEAECICTNSYHGLVYSLIYEKDFCLVPCKRFTSRINSLLELFHIKSDCNAEESFITEYDKAFVKETIIQERTKAMHYLETALLKTKHS